MALLIKVLPRHIYMAKVVNRVFSLHTFSQVDRVLSVFEDKCQRLETVHKKDFLKTYDIFARAIETGEAQNLSENISLYSTMLLRCCGKFMFDTPPETREELAGKLWSLLKDKKLPLDTSHYNSLIRTLNENMSKFDPQAILDEMKAANINPDMITYQRLIQQYSLQGNIEGAINLLETMKNLNFELNESIFASLITAYGKQENPASISDMFELMRSNKVEPGSKSYAAAFISLGERFDKDPKAIDEFKQVYELFEKDEIQLSLNEVLDLIVHLMPYRSKCEALDKLLLDAANVRLGSLSSRYRLLSALIRANCIDEASKLFWSQKISPNAIQSGRLGAYWIKALVMHKNVPVETVISECDRMKETGYNQKPFHQLFFSAAENGRLELIRESFRRMILEEPLKIHYVWPLIAQAKSKDDVIETLKNELDPSMNQSDLLETFSYWVWPKFADDVPRLFELNKELNYDHNMLTASFLNYSVQENKIEDAIKFITQVPEGSSANANDSKSDSAEVDNADAELEFNSRSNRPEIYQKSEIVSRLLQQMAEQTKDPKLVKKAFDICQLSKQQVTARSLAPLINVYMIGENFDGALQEFFRIAKEYRLTPCRTTLMQYCLEHKRPEDLQKIMDTVTELFGEQNALFDLAISCLRLNKLKQAQKIFASPGFRVNPVRVYSACRIFARQNDVSLLENYVKLTRDMYDVNQEILYKCLLDTYERTSNAKRALHLWNLMQEEEFQPSKKSLIMIADILEKNHIEVPFQKPRLMNRS